MGIGDYLQHFCLRIFCSATLLISLLTIANATPLTLASPGGGTASLSLTTFASGLNYPVGLAVTTSGELIVGTTTPSGPANSPLAQLNGIGQLVGFTDSNHDGIADNPAGQVVYAGLPGAVTDVKAAGAYLAAATSGDGGTHTNVSDISILSPSGGGYVSLGALHLTFPASYNNVDLATAPVAGQPTQYYLYFHVAAATHDAQSGPAVTLTGLVKGSLQGGSVYRVIVDTANPASPISALAQVASGIRNSGGMTVDSAGRLVFTDNGYETGPTLTSADELNVIQAANLGGPSIDFGYPLNYVDYATGLPVGSNGQAPEVAFTGLGGQQRVGIAGVAEAPSSFPADLTNGYFVSFHGNYFQSGILNQWNPVDFYSPATHTFFDFVLPAQAGLGNIDSLASSGDWLYMADLAAGGPFIGGTGVIYALTANVPEPGTWVTVLGLTAIVLLRRHSL